MLVVSGDTGRGHLGGEDEGSQTRPLETASSLSSGVQIGKGRVSHEVERHDVQLPLDRCLEAVIEDEEVDFEANKNQQIEIKLGSNAFKASCPEVYDRELKGKMKDEFFPVQVCVQKKMVKPLNDQVQKKKKDVDILEQKLK